ncbi:MAG: type I 3-dehydroquinate dehydratase [Thaumarchaeota archaeon]|nr:type I 3-dehydroquinate dehydratase [Nitrososphaerota archaeon]
MTSLKAGRWRPKICTSVYATDLSVLVKRLTKAVESGSDYVEIRLDYLKDFDIRDLKKACNRFLDQCIFTCRPPREGGVFQGTDEERLKILGKAASLHPRFIDLELDTVSSNSPLIGELKRKAQGVIVSWHSLENTPKSPLLTTILRKAEKYSETVKIVTAANSVDDNFTVLSLYAKARRPLIAFCMGEKGVVSRILCPLFGSPFTYASLPHMPTAAGQVALDDLKTLYQGVKRV